MRAITLHVLVMCVCVIIHSSHTLHIDCSRLSDLKCCKVFHIIYFGNIVLSAGKRSVWENILLHLDNF
jgi:hypothetical protein